jgi:hypothetical protein
VTQLTRLKAAVIVTQTRRTRANRSFGGVVPTTEGSAAARIDYQFQY